MRFNVRQETSDTMPYPKDANGDVFRRMEKHGFNFDIEHVVDFHAVFATEEEADRIDKMFVEDRKAGKQLENIETRPHEVGGMCLDLAVRMIVTYNSVCEFEDLLAARVASVEGYLDGWGVMQKHKGEQDATSNGG